MWPNLAIIVSAYILSTVWCYTLSKQCWLFMATISQTAFSNAFFLNENDCILIRISLKHGPNCPIITMLALIQIMAWRRQAIIWTKGGIVYWCICAPLGLNALKLLSHFSWAKDLITVWIYDNIIKDALRDIKHVTNWAYVNKCRKNIKLW